MDVIRSFEVVTLFERLALTRIGNVISMIIEELEGLSFTSLGENEPLTLEENEIYQIEALEGTVSSIEKSSSHSEVDHASIRIPNFRSFKCSSE